MNVVPFARPALVIQAERADLLRCRCPECVGLDARYPGQGFQLALFAYRPEPKRMLRR